MKVRTFLFLLFVVCAVGTGFAQISMYYEDFDGVTPPALPTGWSSNSSTTQTINNTPSGSYSGASGKQNLFLANCVPVGEYREVLLEGVSTLGHTDIKIRFGHRRTNAFTSPITLAWSADGVNWNTISDYNSNSASTTLWTLYQSSTLPSGADNQANLRFRWSWVTNFNNNCVTSTPNYRMDDVLITAAMVLPVELLTFAARRKEEGVLLEWRTATEKDNDYFEIERSADGTAFASIGRVKGAGTTQIPQAYAFDDLDPLPGVNYYRLRQTDYDGASEYSPVVSVRMDGPGYVISPMPVSGTARVAFDKPTESDTHWRVFASDGALLRAGQVRVGEQGFEFDLNALPAGVYVLRMEQANWAKSERIFKTTLR